MRLVLEVPKIEQQFLMELQIEGDKVLVCGRRLGNTTYVVLGEFSILGEGSVAFRKRAGETLLCSWQI